MERKGKRVCLFILLAVASSAFGSVNVAPRSVIYVSQFFELREDKTPSKLVFNGSSRVARTSGPLSQNPLMQRITLRPGWNLRSLAVTASNALIQLAPASAAHKWVQESSHFTPVTAGETLSAGTVLWLHATVPGSLPVRGAYAQPGTVNVPAGGSFIGAAGFRQWDLANSLPATVSLWKPAKANARWTSAAAAAGEERDAGLTQLSPGEAMYIQPTTPLELRAPDPALDLLYSHEDHLGSSTCVSDSLGRTAEATAFYPFGIE
ncbi:MAG TPA: hypothetical protein VN673_03115, partial [Clostridia bacterium]|nr:hypothetical protein [Clostridia bacterium]